MLLYRRVRNFLHLRLTRQAGVNCLKKSIVGFHVSIAAKLFDDRLKLVSEKYPASCEKTFALAFPCRNNGFLRKGLIVVIFLFKRFQINS